ncbi:hypothetical protein FB45DRAFT_206160 [Roridomyces roridus]|uniref:Uncharacterized protein n=1 Tax=Roridomyces roridus TaxID=1738132 RepID=A0AAD7CG00_9AGAR|nr:hypothetical protein FB45DRAFT_206160 [Roridomyces roridus]
MSDQPQPTGGGLFNNCNNMVVNGGNFRNVNGNLNEHHYHSYPTPNDWHNQDNFGHRPRYNDQTYGYRNPQDGPGRSYSHPAAFPSQEHPYSSHDPGRQATVPALLDSRPREEFTSAHFPNHYHHDQYPANAYRPPPPMHSARSAPVSTGAPWTPGAPGPIPRANSQSYDPTHRSGSPDSISSTDTPHPDFLPQVHSPPRPMNSGGNGQPPHSRAHPRPAHSRPPPSHGQPPRRSQTSFPPNRRPSHQQSERRNSSDDQLDGGSGSESEMPPPSSSRPPRSYSQQSPQNNGASFSQWRR